MATLKQYHHYSSVFTGREGDIPMGAHSLNIDAIKDLKSNTAKSFKEFTSLTDIGAQREYLANNGPAVFEAIQDILDKVDYNEELVRFTLPLLDGILSDNRKNIQFIVRNITNNGDRTLITALNRILENTKFGIIVHEAAAKVQAFVYSELNPRDYREKQVEFLRKLLSLRNQNQGNQNIKVGDYGFVTALVNLLKVEHLVVHFLQAGGATILSSFLENNSGDLQISYYTLLNVWLISYIPESLEQFADPTLGLIRQVTEVIQKLSREKLVRVAFNTFRNLCEHQDSIELMVDAGLIKLIDVLLKGNIKDADVLEDLKYVGEILEVNLKILSSFEKYQKEIFSKNLDWSPVHSEKFWRENIKKFEEEDFKLVKMLIDMLDAPNITPKSQAIICYDLGQFCRFYSYGRNVLEAQGGKSKIMLLTNQSNDQSVRENALLALQKIMLHNWNIQAGK